MRRPNRMPGQLTGKNTYEQGEAITATAYEIGRNDATPNKLQSNVPSGSSHSATINGVEVMNVAVGVTDMKGNILRNVEDPETSDDAYNYGGVLTDIPSKLAEVENINAKTAAATTLYTVPASRKLHLTFVLVQCTAASGVSVAHTASVGGNASDYNDWLPASQSLLTATNTEEMPYSAAQALANYAAGTAVKYNITVGATATSQTLTVSLFGMIDNV